MICDKWMFDEIKTWPKWSWTFGDNYEIKAEININSSVFKK